MLFYKSPRSEVTRLTLLNYLLMISKHTIVGALAVASIIAVPAITLAATYQYVDTSGNLRTETAPDASSALAGAPDIAVHSGVMLVTPTTTTTVVANPVVVTTTATPSAMTSAANLRVSMNNLMSEHVTSSLDVARDISSGQTNAEQGALQEQDANAVDLAAAIGNIYGVNTQTSFLQIFRAHVSAMNAYATAVKNGSTADQQSAMSSMNTQAQALANLLSGVNPNIDNATLLASLQQHETLFNQAVNAFLQNNVTQSYTLERQALTQIQGAADYLTNAAIKQSPARFTN